MKSYKTYRKQRFLFFWLSLLSYFLPYAVVTASLLPLMQAAQGAKWGIGLGVIAINSVPFLGGVFKGFRAYFPFVNVLAIAFVLLAGFFTMKLFQNYVHTFLWIEFAAVLGSVLACVFWHYHRKYKRKSRTVSDVVKSGLVGKTENYNLV